jgi:hypothetical protein
MAVNHRTPHAGALTSSPGSQSRPVACRRKGFSLMK